ncbi:response regulator [Paenibacillus monticola]|uniref:Circadian input-output histidine kinase CikA n=1 Tax=Paenibacillus monticola TaxID=2666075 RepID=A0A7X2H5R2_9BACL|nr:transporter substrate-binding domain-containing protein [Paenibacillus monticola]MRN54019.1 transporter substrate-binding domain-containing protein [Paenibacillus monticola]
MTRIILLTCCFLFLFPALILHGSAAKVDLSAEEKRFITEHPIIHLGVDPQFVPFEFIDSDGTYKGIAHDYIELINARTGLNLAVVPGLTWTQAYEKAVEREIDVLPSVSKTVDRENYFSFSMPYYSFQRVIITKDNNDAIQSFEDLNTQMIAVQENSSHDTYLKSIGHTELSLYSTVGEALEAVSNGTEQAFIGNLATTAYLIRENGITDLKVVKMNDPGNQSLYFAVRKDWPELVSIINKGISSITSEEKIQINNQWIGIENKVDYSNLIQVLVVAIIFVLIVFGVSWYWIRRLKKEIRERKRIQEDLVLAKEEAEIANNIKSSFLARMSHEIRTPLNGITGMTYLMKRTDISVTQKLYMDKISHASKSMEAIINDILDFAKIEADRIEIERISFNLDTVLQKVINIVSFKIEEQGIDFFIDKDPELPSIFFGDPKRIEQILINLINNAVKFTPTGQVSLMIRLVAEHSDLFHIEFTVKDTGIGIAEEQIKYLFEPFNQADISINRRFGGTGLGLSIVKSLLDRMKGEIKVYSALDEGSTFVIQLAFEVDREQEYIEKQKNSSLFIQKIRVVVLEKNQTYTHLMRQYLNSFGIISEFTLSEKKVFELLQSTTDHGAKPYDLIIVDYDTPMFKGIEFIQKINQDPTILVKPKFILMFPLAREDLFDKLAEFSIDLGITKPIIPSVLYNGILEIFKDKIMDEHEFTIIEEQAQVLKAKPNQHILVVEDNKTNQFIAQSILEQAGFNVYLADDGKEGYDFFVQHADQIDLILMDLHMPVLDGYEATRLIRRENQTLPIIAMTADAITGVEERCRIAGITDFVSKPFEPDLLVARLKEILGSLPKNPEKGGVGTVDKPILDVAYGMILLGHREELYKSVLRTFINENEHVSTQLQESLQVKDYIQAKQIVHKIMGSSGNIGAKKIYEIASRLQKAIVDQSESEIQFMHPIFNSALSELLQEMDRYIKVSIDRE